MSTIVRAVFATSFGVFGCLGALPARAAPLEFHLQFAESVSAKPFTGRVYVRLSRRSMRQLPSGPRWTNTEPFFAKDVKNWRPGQVVRLTREDLGYPVRLDRVAKGKWWIQAGMDFNRGDRSIYRSVGNGYSKPSVRDIDGKEGGAVALTLDQVVRKRTIKETGRVKFIEIESELLSKFHKRPVQMRAGVVLPKSYTEAATKRFPVVYSIPGFGGSHTGAYSLAARNATSVGGIEMIRVVLDANCRWGHHVFADSDNNGPCGTALIQELIPHIESQFRAIAHPTARLLTGHSSGGWSSLWLQVTYPDFFGGVWSTAPDPVDFRDFQRVNIYQPNQNIFYDPRGKLRPLGRRGGKVFIWYKSFCDMETVMGHGGQLGSFEAVFSTKGKNGRPRQLWDRRTGRVDPEVAETWKRYDIRLILEENWKTLGPKLRGKIHVFMGTMDNFYLEGATRLLQQSQKKLGSDAAIELIAGRDHSSLMTRALRQRIHREMAQSFRSRFQSK